LIIFCHPINTAWYNQIIENEGLVDSGTLKLLPVPSPSIQNDAGPDPSSYNAVLIGNTKTVWPSFIHWLAIKLEQKKRKLVGSDGGVATHHHHETAADDVIRSNPFDSFCEESLSRSLQELCCGEENESKKITSYELFWSNGKRQTFFTNNSTKQKLEHDTDVPINNQYHCYDDKTQDSFLVSMQRVASVSGEYWHDEENTKLCVHPVHGTWTAFRALVIFETENSYNDTSIGSSSGGGRSNIVSLPPPCPCPLSEEEMKEAKQIFDYALEMNTSGQGSSNIGSYGTQANKTWDELCTYLHNQVCKGSDWDEVPESMKPWIELRNAISVGRSDWKYDEAQLLYHYTKDPNILRRELEKFQCRNIEQNE
jgi:hypothetical protein